MSFEKIEVFVYRNTCYGYYYEMFKYKKVVKGVKHWARILGSKDHSVKIIKTLDKMNDEYKR